MSPSEPITQPVSFAVENGQVSGLLLVPSEPRWLYVFAHGAGAGMRHPFLESIARLLAEHQVATLRYQFPYMEAGKNRTDTPAVAHATVRAAVAAGAGHLPGVPLLAGGKSFGGRMTSQTQAESPLPAVRGLVFFGFPLHAPGKPGVTRGEHLSQVQIPMLFLQGTRDEFAQLDLITQVCADLGKRATLQLVDGANHSFAVNKSGGRTAVQVQTGLCATVAEWAGGLA